MSLIMKYMKWVSKLQYKKQGITDASFDPLKLRETNDESMKWLKPEKGISFRPVQLGSMPGEECTPQNAKDECVILYIHGGGFVAGNAETSRYFASAVCRATGYRVYTCSYRLAPEHPSPAMQEDCISGYEALLALYPDTPIVVMGDSAGAHLTLTTTLWVREKGLRLPACVALSSVPVTWDGTIDRSKNAEKDATLLQSTLDQMTEVVFPDKTTRSDWLASPIYGDYTGFPPVYIVYDADELLAPDSEALIKKLNAAGVQTQVHIEHGAFHAFTNLGYMLPEAKAVLLEIAACIESIIR